MRYIPCLLAAAVLLGGVSCVETDFVEDAVDPELRLTASVDTLGIGDAFQLEVAFFDRVGRETAADVSYDTDRPDVLDVSADGLVTAVAAGEATVTATALDGDAPVRDSVALVVGEATVAAGPATRSGRIVTQSSYDLTGDFTVTEQGGDLLIEVADDYEATTALPGLYVYLSNNDASTADALEIGAVETFSGAHSYTVTGADVGQYRYLLYFCKPFDVRVGSGEFE